MHVLLNKEVLSSEEETAPMGRHEEGSLETNISIMSNMFPGWSEGILSAVVLSTDGNLERAAEIVLNHSGTGRPQSELLSSIKCGAGNEEQENNEISNPNDSNQDIDWPFQFCVFFTGCITERQGQNCCNDNGLPSPEGKGGEFIAEQANLRCTLNDVVRGCEQCTATESKNYSVGVQRT